MARSKRDTLADDEAQANADGEAEIAKEGPVAPPVEGEVPAGSSEPNAPAPSVGNNAPVAPKEE
jgi:hypothetical protein